MTSLLTLLFSTGPTAGSDTSVTPGSPDSPGSAAFASSLAGLLGSTSPSTKQGPAEPDSAAAAVEDLHPRVDDTGNPLPPGGNERQFLAASVSEQGRPMDPQRLMAVPLAGLKPAGGELAFAALRSPRVAEAGANDRATVTATVLAQRGAATLPAVGLADPSAATGFTSMPAGSGSLLGAALAASKIAVPGVQMPSTSGMEATASSGAVGDDAMGAMDSAEQRHPLRLRPRADGWNPRLQAFAAAKGSTAMQVAGAAARAAASVTAGATAGAATAATPDGMPGQMALSASGRMAGMAQFRLAGASSERQKLGVDTQSASASASGAGRGKLSALSVYAATFATTGATGQPGANLETSNRLAILESGGPLTAKGTTLGPAPSGPEASVTEPLQVLRPVASMVESTSSTRSAETPAGSSLGLSLTDGREAAETLVQRMLHSQAQQLSSIRFQLRPAELGHLDVQMQWRGDQLQLAFTAQQAAARDLIEGYLPQLRQLMQDMGLQLAGVDVRLDPDARDSAQRQLQQQLGQHANQNPGQNPGQGGGQHATAQRDPQGQALPGPSGPSAPDGTLDIAGSEASDSRSAGARLDGSPVVIDAFV